MAVVAAGVGEAVDAPVVVAERLEAFGVEVLAGAMNRPVQVRNGGLYLRGLLEHGARKSLEPLVERLAADADYQSLQQFLGLSWRFGGDSRGWMTENFRDSSPLV